MDLFEYRLSSDTTHAPLAERLRPGQLSEVIGHDHAVGPTGFLTKLIASGRALPSLLLWGPPGTGKTTIGRLLAKESKSDFVAISAVSSGVATIRDTITSARRKLAEHNRRTLAFVDEIHRFSKSQQDALLPAVENGTIILVGATTENPSFEVNRALLSRLRVVTLESLRDDDMERLLARGLDALNQSITDAARTLLIRRAAGDGRALLLTLDIASRLTDGQTAIDTPHIAEAAQQPVATYDKQGENHFACASALIKSMRASDADAAAYWLTRMLEGGEQPNFVSRRLVIFASEDIGNADPQALVVATAAAQAAHMVGLPEAVLPLCQAAIYLACAPKSNAALTTYASARKAVHEHGPLPVPEKLRNAATALDKARGHGRGYRYPHNFEGTYAPENLLPEALAGARFYDPPAHEREVITNPKDALDSSAKPG